jgi:hypothetical protein
MRVTLSDAEQLERAWAKVPRQRDVRTIFSDLPENLTIPAYRRARPQNPNRRRRPWR